MVEQPHQQYNLSIDEHKKETITDIRDFIPIVKSKLDKGEYGYFSAGADQQITLRHNTQTFNRIMLMPRELRDMTQISMSSTFLGWKVQIPFGVAPVAMQKLMHPDGQIAVAGQTAKQGTIYGLSMISTTPISQISPQTQNIPKIYQIYFLKSAQYTQKLVKLIQQHNFQAIQKTS